MHDGMIAEKFSFDVEQPSVAKNSTQTEAKKESDAAFAH
jgi:hypothetical protein